MDSTGEIGNLGKSQEELDLIQFPDLAEEFLDLSSFETVTQFADTRKEAIKLLRAYHSQLARIHLSDELRNELVDEITNLSRGALSVTQGLLCEISNDGLDWVKKHSGEIFNEKPDKSIDGIKGFYFTFHPFQTAFECFILDQGRSREAYDLKTQEEKTQFLTNFASTRSERFSSELYPFGYAALLEDDPEKGFKVLQVVSHPKPNL